MARKQIDPQKRQEVGRERRARTRAKIVAAAFDVFGEPEGLYARIEDVAERAGVRRSTFYNHFTGMEELRDALNKEVMHEFLTAVTRTIAKMPDARDRSAVAIRYYLHRARSDHRWAWSMINMSATGLIFGADTFHQAEQTVREGVESGAFPIPSVMLGRDLLLGFSLAALGSIVREKTPEDYPEAVAGYILFGLGVPHVDARRIAHQELPPLETSPGTE